MRVVFLGAPGSGKGTQAKFISRQLGVPAVSTGDMLRAAVQAGTPLGRKAQSVMDSGNLVPDDVVMDLIRQRIAEPDAHQGFLLDGYPRTQTQAESLERLLFEQDAALDAVVNLVVPEEMLIARLTHRSDGRADDKLETVRERLRVYREKTEPLIEYYRNRGLLCAVDGEGDVAEIAGRIERAIASARQGVA